MQNKINKLKAFLIFIGCFIGVSAFAATSGDSCSPISSIQYKPNGTCWTINRTCCANGYYSNWGYNCTGADNCRPGQCWTGSVCVDPTQTQPTTQPCASGCGTQSRVCKANCSGGSCEPWTGFCSAPTQTQATTQKCGTNGTQSRTCTASCSGGSCGAWSTCKEAGPVCNERDAICTNVCGWIYSDTKKCPMKCTYSGWECAGKCPATNNNCMYI